MAIPSPINVVDEGLATGEDVDRVPDTSPCSEPSSPLRTRYVLTDTFNGHVELNVHFSFIAAEKVRFRAMCPTMAVRARHDFILSV
jgi:hypothetical protein